MNFNLDTLVTIIGKQAIQIALLEAELASQPAPVDHKAMTLNDRDELRKVFDESV